MKRLHLAVVLLSLALIAFQLALIQILSIVQWYHFAYMVISIALLGFGASGSLIALARDQLLKRLEHLLPFLMFSTGATMAVTFSVSQLNPFRFDSYLLFVDSSQIRALILNGLIFFVPFFFGALALGLIFVQHVNNIGSLYFANLLGSGLGGAVAIALMWFFLPQQFASFVAIFPIVAGLLILPNQHKMPLVTMSILTLFLSAYFTLRAPKPVLSEYKSLSRTLLLPDAKINLERNSPHGLVQVVSSPALRYAPGVSLSYRKVVPSQQALFNNGDWFGPVTTWSHEDKSHVLDYTTMALPYVMESRNQVLVLNARTGIHIAQAITHGAKQIVAVEPHATAVSLLSHELAVADIGSLFQHPSVTTHVLDPRTYLSKDHSTQDLIVLPMIDSFGGTSGLFALQEQYVLTKEAIHEMWERLTTNGVISISTWMDYPFRSPLKVFATLVEVLEEAGTNNVASHLAAVRSWGTITFVAKRSELSGDDIRRIREFCDQMYFDPALLPQIDPKEQTRHNLMEDLNFFVYLREILSSKRKDFYAIYDFRIQPATDNRPYFSQFIRWKSLPRLRKLLGDRSMPFLEVGYLVVGVTFLQIFVAAVVLIILPLIGVGKSRRHWVFVILYFGSLGLGYIFMEIVLIQRLILYLGQPIYASAAAISALLICSGVGSLVSSRLQASPVNLKRMALLVAILILIYAFILGPLLGISMRLPIMVKATVSFLLIAPLAVAMGFPFPLGLRFLALKNESLVPWAWGVNGCLSVIGTALATIIAVEAGFSVLYLVAAGVYSVSAMSVSRKG